MAEDPGSTLAAVELITMSYAIIGDCRGLNERLRLIDLLNNPEFTHLQLTDVKVRQILHATDIIASQGPIFIDKKSVVLGRSLASPEDEARRDEAHRLDQVQKERRLMLIFAPPFRILGNVHLYKDVDMTIAVPKLSDGFLAITEAIAVREEQCDVVFESEFVALNGRRIEGVCEVPADYQQTHLSLAGAIKQIGPADAEKSAA
jgi:hypothetical protein